MGGRNALVENRRAEPPGREFLSLDQIHRIERKVELSDYSSRRCSDAGGREGKNKDTVVACIRHVNFGRGSYHVGRQVQCRCGRFSISLIGSRGEKGGLADG